MVHPDLREANYTRFQPPTQSVVHGAIFMDCVPSHPCSLLVQPWGRLLCAGYKWPEQRHLDKKLARVDSLGGAMSELFLGALAWVVAWTRFEWFSDWQLHTFTPLWICYVVRSQRTYLSQVGSLHDDPQQGFLWASFCG